MAAVLPLTDWRVLVTRPANQARSLVQALRQAGATAIAYPTIAVEAPPSWARFDDAIASVASYGWVVFTSPSAVRSALARAPGLKATLRASKDGPRVAAVGSQTAGMLAEHGVPVTLMPEDGAQRQEGLVAGFIGSGTLKPGTRVLLPQAIGGRELLHEALTAVGAIVDVVPVSRTVALPLFGPPPAFDVATFASPSALRAFVDRLKVAALHDKVVAVIGPTTRDAAIAAGVTVQVESTTPSVAGLVDALAAYRLRG